VLVVLGPVVVVSAGTVVVGVVVDVVEVVDVVVEAVVSCVVDVDVVPPAAPDDCMYVVVVDVAEVVDVVEDVESAVAVVVAEVTGWARRPLFWRTDCTWSCTAVTSAAMA
jgi:hypothetical protein